MLAKSFSQVRTEAEESWEKLLSKIRVIGGTEEEKETFYSTFYRSFLWPILLSDENGEFVDANGNTVNKGVRYYSNPSFWDDYRNKLILLGMISPDVATDVIKSITDRGKIGGFMPTFFHGDHASTFVTGSYLRGIRDFDVQAAYELLLNNAFVEGSGKGPMGGRRFIKEYMEQGWISEDDITNPKLETVAKAAKVSDEIRPELVVNISINKMCINGLASKMLNIETGDYMKAMVLTADQCENDVNKKFFIMVSKVKTDDMMTLAAVGKAKGVGRKLFCSYAACYSQFLQNTPDAQAITADKLTELGYAYGIDKKDSEGKPYTKYTANREVHYELIDTGIDYPNSDGSMLRIWACVNAQIIDRPYDPSVEAETAADDAENKKTDAPETVADTANAETAAETQDETAASQETAGDGDDI